MNQGFFGTGALAPAVCEAEAVTSDKLILLALASVETNKKIA